MRLTYNERDNLLDYLFDLEHHIDKTLINPVNKRLGKVVPTELHEVTERLDKFKGFLNNKFIEDELISEEYWPYAKLAIMIARRRISEEQSNLRDFTAHPTIHTNIDGLMGEINNFINMEWYGTTKELKLPAVTDFLTLETVYGIFGRNAEAPEPKFEDKFGILQIQRNFLPSLHNVRLEAQLRNIDITVAFVDIDDFKKLNTRHTESLIDRLVLPPVMRLIEAHVYSHGSAFKFGGDEYLLLLPNMSTDLARVFLFQLQDKLSKLAFLGISEKIAVSIGCCTISSSAMHTNQEILDAATEAKKMAKTRKNCVATYANDLLLKADLHIIGSTADR